MSFMRYICTVKLQIHSGTVRSISVVVLIAAPLYLESSQSYYIALVSNLARHSGWRNEQ